MAEDARGCTALHYACRTLARSKKSASASVEDLNLIKEGAEEVTARTMCIGLVSVERLRINTLKMFIWTITFYTNQYLGVPLCLKMSEHINKNTHTEYVGILTV